MYHIYSVLYNIYNLNVMRRKYTKHIVLCGTTLVTLAILAFASGCVSMQTHSPITKDTRITLVDSVTKELIDDADVFHFTMLAAYGCAPLAESHWREIRYHYAGHREMPYAVPYKRYRTKSYNFLLWQRRPARCYTAVVFYKRGYLTGPWVPGTPKEVPLLKLADSNMNDKGTGEGSVDWLLKLTCLRSPEGHRGFYWTREDALLGDARALKRYVSSTHDYNRIVEFAISEYRALLDTDLSSDPRTRPRISKKINDLSELIGKK